MTSHAELAAQFECRVTEERLLKPRDRNMIISRRLRFRIDMRCMYPCSLMISFARLA